MRIFNQEKTQELKCVDLKKGYLQQEKLFISHYEAVEAVEEQSHYVVVAEYANGGKDLKKVIDVPAVEAQAAYDKYEDIQVYIPFTKSELARREIANLKAKLAATDYQAIKYAEGVITAEEYAEMKVQRQSWRDKINELESTLKE